MSSKNQARTDSPAVSAASTESARATDASWLRTELSRAELNLESLGASRYPASNPSVVSAAGYVDRLRQKLAESQSQEGSAALVIARDNLQVAERREAELKKAFDATRIRGDRAEHQAGRVLAAGR